MQYVPILHITLMDCSQKLKTNVVKLRMMQLEKNVINMKVDAVRLMMTVGLAKNVLHMSMVVRFMCLSSHFDIPHFCKVPPVNRFTLSKESFIYLYVCIYLYKLAGARNLRVWGCGVRSLQELEIYIIKFQKICKNNFFKYWTPLIIIIS